MIEREISQKELELGIKEGTYLLRQRESSRTTAII